MATKTNATPAAAPDLWLIFGHDQVYPRHGVRMPGIVPQPPGGGGNAWRPLVNLNQEIANTLSLAGVLNHEFSCDSIGMSKLVCCIRRA